MDGVRSRRGIMDGITASEIAGLGVGAILFCVTVAAPKVDAFISASERSSLGMCKKCGNLRVIACSGCQGVGFTKDRGPFGFILTDDFSFGDGSENGSAPVRSKPCTNCSTKGRINCPECYGKPQI